MERYAINKVMEYLAKKDITIGKVYDKTYQIHSEIIQDYERLYSSLANKYYEQKQENEKLLKENNDLKQNLEKANQEKVAVLDIGENMEKQVKDKHEENKKLQEEFKAQMGDLQTKLEEIEKENQMLYEKLVTHAKERADKILANEAEEKDKKSLSDPENRSENIQEVKSNNISPLSKSSKTDTFKLYNIGSAKKNEQIGATNLKLMTLKQLKDVINEIYENKEKHDEKCRRTRLPLETMEQFMFTHLNQKYGLKNLIIEWAASIVNGVKCYMKEDSDVALFAKLLKNEVEEDFRYIQDKIKTSVSKVLRKYLREKYKHKGELELNSIQENLEQGFISNQT